MYPQVMQLDERRREAAAELALLRVRAGVRRRVRRRRRAGLAAALRPAAAALAAVRAA